MFPDFRMISPEAMQRMTTKMKERVVKTPPGTWSKLGIGVLVGGVAIGWFAFPYVLDKVVASQINLAQGKDSRKLWVQLPQFDFNIYLFNITNPAEVMRGAKPDLQEVGPYCYKEIKEKTDFIEDPTTDTISYSARNTWHVNPESPLCSTSGLTGEELLVVPNIPMLVTITIVSVGAGLAQTLCAREHGGVCLRGDYLALQLQPLFDNTIVAA
ncbi:Plays an olfactory role that is not restricted to pheromone sensitivity [Homalodisca vitripennis]|nr:Plays an olfactory role that is not restricted to pheromone sensitivity [Homalodisca vitripennis]